MKKSYVEKAFNKEFLKDINLQELGVYYSTKASNIVEEKRADLDIDENMINNNEYVSIQSIDLGRYLINPYDYEYDYTDEDEIDCYLGDLMKNDYSHYLVVLFNSRWTNASGYKIFDKYIDCFIRDYDVSMYVKSSSGKGKSLGLREYHHDKPMGHESIIIGLTEAEYEKLENMSIEDIISYGKAMQSTLIEL